MAVETTPHPLRSEPRWYLIVALALAAVLLYLSFRGVDWTQLLDVLRRARLDTLFVACLILSISYFARSLRWRILLSAGKRIARTDVFGATMVGYLGNNLLPARAGELMRTALLSRRAGLNAGFILGTIFTERMIDVVAVVLFGGGAFVALNALNLDKPVWWADAVQGAGLLGVGVVAMVFLAVRSEGILKRLLARLPFARAASVRPKLARLLDHFLNGLQTFREPRRALGLAGLTVAIWLIDSLAVKMIAQALSLTLTWPEALVFIAALALSSAVPSTPGYVGVYQFVAVTVLAPFGIAQTEALAYILAFQAVAYVAVVTWGVWGLWRLRGRVSP
jgi:hypothetical protein